MLLHRLLFLASITIPNVGYAQWGFVRVDDGTKPVIALGADCRAEVSYMREETNGYVRHAAIPRGGQPSISMVDQGYFYGPLDIATDATGGVYVNYHDHDDQDQVVAFQSGAAWDLWRVEDPGHDGWDNSIVVTDDGVVHTSSIDPSGFGGIGVEYARRSVSGEWSVLAVGSAEIMYSNATSIAVKPDGNPVIAYYNDISGDLEIAERSGSNWSVTLVDSFGDAGRFPSLAVDQAGDLHVAYYSHANSGGTIRYAKRTGSSWIISDVDALMDVQLGFSGARRVVALALEDNDTVHLAYADKSRVVYASGMPGSWVHETIVDETASGTVLGQQVDLARCGDDGTLHIVYHHFESSNPDGVVWYGTTGVTVGVEATTPQLNRTVQVYPNPSLGQVTIRVDGKSLGAEPAVVSVVDLLGRILISRALHEEVAIVRGLSSGVYVAQLRVGDRNSAVRFVVAGR